MQNTLLIFCSMSNPFEAYEHQDRPWITYLPCNSEGTPLLNALCDDAQRIMELSPFDVWTNPHPTPEVGTLMVCHSQALVQEAIGIAEARPLIIWAWLLDEEAVILAAKHVPVVFGAVRWLEDIVGNDPSQPVAYVSEQARICAQLEHAYQIPSSDSLMVPR